MRSNLPLGIVRRWVKSSLSILKPNILMNARSSKEPLYAGKDGALNRD